MLATRLNNQPVIVAGFAALMDALIWGQRTMWQRGFFNQAIAATVVDGTDEGKSGPGLQVQAFPGRTKLLGILRSKG